MKLRRAPLGVGQTRVDPGRAVLAPFRALTDDEAGAWLGQLHEAGRTGRFFLAVTIFTVSGRRPGIAR